MNFINVDVNKFSALQSLVSFSEDDTILLVKFIGKYGCGSAGNGDGTFMFSTLAANYFISESIVLILDVRDLEYSWGNTIAKSLNFFCEIGRDEYEKNKKVVIITSENNRAAIIGILEFVNEGNRLICDDYNWAISEAEKYVEEYLA